MENIIIEKETLFEAILETSPIAIVALKAIRNASNEIIDFQYILANTAAERFLKKRKPELLSSTILREFPETLESGFYATCLRVIQTGKPEYFEREFQSTVFSGWTAVRIAKIDDGVLFNFYDITEEKIHKEELRRQKLILEESQSIAHVGTFIYDVKKDIATWTKELYNIYEIEANTQITIGFLDRFMHPEDKKRRIESYEKALKEKTNYEIVYRIITGKNNIKYIWTRGIVSYSEQGEPLNIIGTVLDITDLKSMEKELVTWKEKLQKITQELQQETKERSKLIEYTEDLKKINIELDKYAYIIGHDLKSPLASIEAILTLLKEEYNNKILDADGINFINMALGRVNIMGDMIKDILYGMKVKEKVRQPVNFNELLKTVIEGLKLTSNIKISVQENFPTINCNKLTMIQVFQNLLNNAIKFMNKAEGKINITFEDGDGFYLFSVSDNGKGIKKELIPKLFEMFQSGESGKIESTGIGLAIVQKTIQEHGGQVWVESKEGQGSVFHFTLPK